MTLRQKLVACLTGLAAAIVAICAIAFYSVQAADAT